MYSQERQKDDTQFSSIRLLGRRDESSVRFRKLERGEDIQFGRSLEKVFKNLQKNMNLAGDAPVIGIEALKINVLIWGFSYRQ